MTPNLHRSANTLRVASIGAGVFLFVALCTEMACTAPSTPSTTTPPAEADRAEAPSTTTPAAANAPQGLPGAVPFERAPASFSAGDQTWTFTPNDAGYAVVGSGPDQTHYQLKQLGRSFHLVNESVADAKPMVINWGPLGFSIGRDDLGDVFLSMRLTSKGWEIHRPGKVVVGRYQGPLLRLPQGAATARAVGPTEVRAKIAGRAEVVHRGALKPREVVLCLLPDLSFVEAATVALYVAEERW